MYLNALRTKAAAIVTAAGVVLSGFALTSISGVHSTAEAANNYQPLGTPTTTVNGQCSDPIPSVATTVDAATVNSHEAYTGVESRLKPGTTDTIQILIRGKSWKDYKYFNLPNALQIPDNIMFIEPRDEYNSESNEYALHVSLDDAQKYFAAGGYQQVPVEVQENGHAVMKDDRLYTQTLPWGNTGENSYDGGKEYIYHNVGDAKYLSDNARYNIGVKDELQADSSGRRMTAWWRKDSNDKKYGFAIYIETKVIDPKTTHDLYFVASQKDFWGTGGEGGSFKIVWSAPVQQKAKIKGYYDSPILQTALFGGVEGEELPKGLQIIGHFEKDGKIIKNVGSPTSGNSCVKYTDGYINFAADNIKDLWKNLGQNGGREFIMPNGEQEGVVFKYDIYADKAMTQKVPFTIPDPSDRMQSGYLPAVRADGSVVPVKVMYYIEPGEYGSYDKYSNVTTYNVRIRPAVLPDKDPEFPLNPISINPYRNVVKWLDFRDPSQGGDQVSSEIRAGQTLERDIIPGFLKLKCEINRVESRLDTYAPGYYYEDGAPWIVGDHQMIGIHQVDNGSYSTVEMTCWGEQNNPNNPGMSRSSNANEVPVNGFVLLDAESTDGGENLSIELLGSGANQKYYPIAGYSSCNKINKNALDKLQLGADVTEVVGSISPYTSGDGNAALQFSNPQGRCGEKPNNKQYGANMGPSLMVVAPVDTHAARESGNVRQKVRVSMKGNGKEALSVGVVLAGDTSNADYNNGMPPVFQYSALNFHGGLTNTGADVDWTLPENYNHNYYYYGARIGKRSRSINDPRTLATSGAGSNLPLQIRDGEENDGMASEPVLLKQGNDATARVQRRLLPIEDTARKSNYDTGYAAEPHKYLAGQDTETMTVREDGAVLNAVPRPTTPLKVTVPCGTAQNQESYVRGWADFNGNGVFDPEEASTVGVCPASSKEPRTDFVSPTNEMPWTETSTVTLTFDYPMHHDLNGKRDVWMRLRSVVNEDKYVLENVNRGTVNVYSGSPVQKNTDKDAPTDLRSVLGSFAFSSSGETEDYLFTVTPPVVTKQDAFCLAQSAPHVDIDVLANDIDPNHDRDVDPDSLVFLANQDGVVISNMGKKAVRKGEGTYEVINGKIRFTPEPGSKLADAIAKLTADSDPLPLQGVKYAVQTGKKHKGIVHDAMGKPVLDADGHDRTAEMTTMHRVLANTAGVTGSVSFACNAQAQASYWLEKTGEYQWDLQKTVLKGNEGTEYVATGDAREMNDAPDGTKVPLTYQLAISAKEKGVKVTGIKGDVALINPTDSDVTTGSTTGISLTVEPASANLTCTFDDPESVKNLVIPAHTTSAIIRTYTCTGASVGDLPAGGFSVKPVIETTSPSSGLAATEPDTSKGSVGAGADAVRLVDSLTVGTDNDANPTVTDLGDVTVNYKGVDVPLSSLRLNAGDIVAKHPVDGEKGLGKLVLTMVLPEDKQPAVPTYAQEKLNYSNTAKLCSGTNATDCVAVDKISDPTNPDAPTTVEPATAITTVTRQENVEAPAVRIKKVGGEDGTTPLKGSNFALYADNAGKISTEITGGISPVVPTGGTAEDATDFTTIKLTADTSYWLVEVKAPVGHQLLAEPVKFRVSRDGVITIEHGGSDYITTTSSDVEPVITVRDVEVGHLPASGGRGVLISLAVGLLLLGFSSMTRRPWRRH